MSFILIVVAVALLILAYWALILWFNARGDRVHLEREQLKRVFGESDT